MNALSLLETFEHGPEVVYVNAYRSVLEGWTVNVTIVGPVRGTTAATHQVAAEQDVRYPSSAEALAAGEQMARAYLDGKRL